MKLKNRIFEIGVKALKQIAALESDSYVCPICLTEFDISALENGFLTLEHVPPKSIGGIGIILTCKKCNNQAGHRFESHAAKRQKLHNFVEVLANKKEGKGGRAKLSLGDISVNVDIETVQGKTKISIPGNVNNPNLTGKLQRRIEAMANADPQPQLKFDLKAHDNYKLRQHQLSLLKAAYLVVVAKIGYKYALSPALDIIREQILRPDEIILPNWQVRLGQISEPKMIAVDHDNGIVVVTIGNESVVLPWPPKGIGVYRESLERLNTKDQIKLNCNVLAWPTSFEAVVDYEGARC